MSVKKSDFKRYARIFSEADQKSLLTKKAVNFTPSGILVPVDGGNYVIGGTSAAAPFWAGITAIMNEALGRNLGFMNPIIYSKFKQNGTNRAFHDVTSGNNSGYTAKVGWDACTGCGTPNVTNLIAALR